MTTPPCINGDESHILTSLEKKQVTKDYIGYNSINIKCKNMPNQTIYYLGRFSIYLSIYIIKFKIGVISGAAGSGTGKFESSSNGIFLKFGGI